MGNYEQKYKEALSWARSAIKAGADGMLKEDLERVFPELKESEDEKIRKELIAFLERKQMIPAETKNEWIAWLEKQGNVTQLSEEEQNRFVKGVLSSCAMSFIDYLDAHKYEGKMCVSNGECVDIENAFHNSMWDRLHRYYCKFIEKQCGQKPYPETLDKAIELYYYSYGNGKGGFDNLSLENFKDIIKTFVEDYGNKSSWSEEDEKMLSKLIKHFEWKDTGYRFTKEDCLEATNWLKSLKDRVQPQPKQEWSEEDEKISNAIYESIDFLCLKSFGISEDEVCAWLKSLRPRHITYELDAPLGYDKDMNPIYTPINHWKPSEEQMDALDNAKNCPANYYNIRLTLESLYNDLRKL